jgi:para-aminobenzoate synthetase component 1
MVVPLPGWREPLEILPRFAAARMPVLLASTGPPEADSDVSRWSILCADPFEVISWSISDPGDPFDLLERAVAAHPRPPAGDLPFAGGAVGYIGYEAGFAVESIRQAPGKGEAGLGTPDLLFGLYDGAVVWDHRARRWWVVSGGGEESENLVARAREGAAPVRRTLPPADDPGRAVPILGTSLPEPEYLARVREARRLIEVGEIYQVNLSQRLELPAPVDPGDLATALARLSPAPFSAWLDAGSFQIVSASPERFLALKGRRVESRPIKGTRPRGRTPAQDAAMREELVASPKDRAENVMIADLVRNDLGRVCKPGSVRCEAICRPEAHSSVHHLVSVVTGELGEGRSRADLLRALFPGGSMTGAPKVRAMQAIEDLEPVPRGVYAGALGYLSFCGAMDLSIVIRTAIVARERTWLQVGGGVVADSDAAAEHRESLDKADSVMRGLAATAWREWRRPGR